MRDLFLKYLLYPMATFAFEFIGDRPWLMIVIALAIAILIWRFCMPVVRGFYALFGWQGVALLAAALASVGIFGAGWRAHRDAVLTPGTPEYHGDKPAKPLKPKRGPAVDNDGKNLDPLFPDGDDFFKKIFHRE